MPHTLKIAIAQGNPLVGAIKKNLDHVKTLHRRAAQEGAHLLLLSELFTCGYSPEDMLRKPSFVRACHQHAQALAQALPFDPAILLPLPWPGPFGKKAYNAVALLEHGKIKAVRCKHQLPNEGVFDEKRVFQPGPLPNVLEFRGLKIGIPICEDLWSPGVCRRLSQQGAHCFLSPNASPFEWGKAQKRLNTCQDRVQETGIPLVYCNQFGGQDDLVFDGGSFGLDGQGQLVFSMARFASDFTVTSWIKEGKRWRLSCDHPVLPALEPLEEAWHACVVGLRDYVEKNGFFTVMLGLSGGIDSAVVAALAVDALGKERVFAYGLPSRFTSQASLDDAQQCAHRLGISFQILAIENTVTELHNALGTLQDPRLSQELVKQNLQARTRGTLLMALSNATGALLLTTGNKSELSVGYATLYGDMNGGFNPIKDLYKTEVYALAHFRNHHLVSGCLGPKGQVIPENILRKPPSAELADGQTDQDTLPPYPTLDAILKNLVEEHLSLEEVCALGHDENTVKQVAWWLKTSEYKRKQSAPGPKISTRAYGRERRYPITNGEGR